MLVYAATGVGPFGTGASHAVAYRTVHEPPALDRVPPALRGVVGACLEKDPGRRPTVARLVTELLSGSDGSDGASSPIPPHDDWLPPAVARMMPSAGGTLPPLGPAGRDPAWQRPTADAAAPVALGPGGATRAVPSTRRAPGLTRRRALLGLTGAAAVVATGAGGWLSGIGRGGTGATPAATAPPKPGTLRWKSYAIADADDEANGAETANLTVVHGLLHVAGSTALYALSADSGAKKWAYAPGHKWEWTNPAVAAAGDTVFLGVDGTVHALHAATGTKRWVQSTAGDYAYPTVHDEALYTVSVDDEGSEFGARTWLYAASAKTGTERWSKEADQQRSPVSVAGDSLYNSIGGVLFALRPDTGDTRWQFDTGGPAADTPTVSGGTVYVNGVGHDLTEGAVFAVSAATGRKLWEWRKSDTPLARPTVAGDIVLVSNIVGAERSMLWALDAKSGKVIWQRHLADGFLTRPATADGAVYVVGDGVLYALRAATGATVWRYDTKTSVHADPLVVGDTIYLSSSTGKVYAVWA
ncbi:PQQ-binding-like beta-propeller repeat protein [Streptomyces sp. NPDC059906]|uniref:outer membrane protein assembly factor BamB family protein n=1 Tax=Streptomyces sp. NPDC059906 TaxID=3346997 RepID=UPI003662E68A